MKNLYERPLPSKRTGPLYNAFSYPTKIDPEAIAVFVAAHTRPNQVVLDVFGGSGTTGIAVRLCDKPTERMRQMAEQAGVDVKWGPRKAHVYELSPMGALVGHVMSNSPDPDKFTEAAQRLLEKAEEDIGHLYQAIAPDGERGEIRYIIWAELLRTPCCGTAISLYDATVTLDPASMASAFDCPSCSEKVEVTSCERVTEEVEDALSDGTIRRRCRVPARVYGRTGSKTWSRPPIKEDLTFTEKVPRALADWVPTGEIYWGDLYRSGYHAGITRYYHFYTPRNLAVFAHLWALAGKETDPAVRDALQLLLLSYNASHSTLLTRVVPKKSQKDFVVTGAQSGVLYVSGLPVEKNLLAGVRRKVKTFADAFALTWGSRSEVTVTCRSSTSLALKDDSVDYVFTDPPFGNYIPYAEVNQVNEAWLGRLTERADEAIISAAQKKRADDYGRLMLSIFSEVARVLRPNGWATVVFHASKPAVWEALGNAFGANGLQVETTSVLDKEQVSFKQVVSEGGTRGDAVFLLTPEAFPTETTVSSEETVDSIEGIIQELEDAAAGRVEELAARRMWSRYVARCVQLGNNVALSAPQFYAALRTHRRAREGGHNEGVA